MENNSLQPNKMTGEVLHVPSFFAIATRKY